MIFLDHNATTPLDPAVLDAMLPFLREHHANPSSPYTAARKAAAAIETARQQVAGLIGAASDEIIFTAGGTESNNTALHSAVANAGAPSRLLVSAVEHASVMEAAQAQTRWGHTVGVVAVRGDGRLDEASLEAALENHVTVIAVMMANNESGVLFDVAAVAAKARARGALVHTDAVQAAGKIPVRVRDLGVDTLSLCAHKMHGPKGVGALFIREGLDFVPLVHGGGQEQARRAGTENVAGIVGFGKAAELAAGRIEFMQGRIASLRDAMEHSILSAVPRIEIAGARGPRLPNTSLLLIEGVEAEALIARLDMEGLCVSSGSACASGANEPSHVLSAMGISGQLLRSAVRISLGWNSTSTDTDCLVRRLCVGVQELREVGARTGSARGGGA